MNDIRSECRLCGVAAGGHSHRCVARPVMSERADYGPPDDSYFQKKFDEAIRRNWPSAAAGQTQANAVRAGIIGDVARQVDEITGVGKALDQASGQAQQQPVGGKLKGDHYYRVSITEPVAPDVEPYVAECADIIEALGMTFNEGEAFKAVWRLAAARRGKVKPGAAGPQYDADKVAHYGARVAAQTAQEAKKGRKP